MKIAFCANTSWYLYNYRKNLIAALRHAGHQVSAISPRDQYSPLLQALGVAWHPLRLSQTSTNPLVECATIFHLFRQLRDLRPDLLLTFTIKCNLYAGVLSTMLPFRQIANVSGLGEAFDRQNLLTKGICALYRLAFSRIPRVFFQNREDMAAFLHQRILRAEQCERLPGSGVDLSTFTPSSGAPESQRRIFLMAGRLLPQKGYDLFLQAAARLHLEYREHAVFWIVGIPDLHRSDSRELLQRIQEYHARKIVTYFSETADIRPVMQQADVVVLPSSYHEGVPRSLLEGMACGKPLITTNWKGCRDTVDDGVNGLLIEPNDADALTRAIAFFLRADREMLARMGMASRQKAAREFDERQIIARYLDAIGWLAEMA